MNRVTVVSRSIRSVGYDPGLRVLEIDFQDATAYRYVGVPPSVPRRLVDGVSPLAYLHQHIRGHFPSMRVR